MRLLWILIAFLLVSVVYCQADTNTNTPPAANTNLTDAQAALELEKLKLEEQKLALETAQTELEKEREAMRMEQKKEDEREARSNALSLAVSQIKHVYLLRFQAITNACHPQMEARSVRNEEGQLVRHDVPIARKIQRDGNDAHQLAFKFNIVKYIDGLKAIDTSKCPRDFQQSFFDYIIACQKKRDYNPLSLAQDSLETVASVKSVSDSGLEDVAKRRQERDTAAAWAEVQKIAIKHGVSARSIKMDLVDGVVGKDIDGVYSFWLDVPQRPQAATH